MKREGKTLKTLPDGHPRRLADGRNAWRKMTGEQRREFFNWISSHCESPISEGDLDLITGRDLVERLTGRSAAWPRCERCGQFATECQADDNPPHPFTLAGR